MGTEDQIHKGDSKYQKAKIKKLEQRLDSQKYNIKNTKQNISQRLTHTYILETCFKYRVFYFCSVIVGYKNEN